MLRRKSALTVFCTEEITQGFVRLRDNIVGNHYVNLAKVEERQFR